MRVRDANPYKVKPREKIFLECEIYLNFSFVVCLPSLLLPLLVSREEGGSSVQFLETETRCGNDLFFFFLCDLF